MIKVEKTLTRYIGVAKIFDWEKGQNANHTQYLNQIFSKRGPYYGSKIPYNGGSEAGPRLACNLDFAKEKGLRPKVKNISETV